MLSSRLCLTHKRVTQKYRNSTFIKKNKKKKHCARIGSESAILRIFWIGSDRIWKNGIVASLAITPVFRVKTSLRYHPNMLIWCSRNIYQIRNISYYYQCFIYIGMDTSSLCIKTLGSNRINLIDKDNGRGILFGQSKDISHHAWTLSEILLHKLRSHHTNKGRCRTLNHNQKSCYITMCFWSSHLCSGINFKAQ